MNQLSEDESMRNKFKSVAAFGLSAVLTIGSAVFSLSAIAANYVPVPGSTAENPTFQKYLIMRAGDTTPNVSFQYTVTAGTPRSVNTDDNGVMEVRAGIDPEKITVTDAVFTAGQTTYPSAAASQIDVQRTDRTNTRFETEKGEKFAVSSGTVDFSGISFPEPGIYRYVLNETLSSRNEEKGIARDEDADRILDVYVTDNGNGTLEISAYVLHMDDQDVVINSSMGSGDVSEAGAKLEDKTDGFTSEYASRDLAFIQKVDGNQASRDKYFALTLELTGLTEGDQYVVSLSDDGDANTTDGNADASISADPNAATTVITSAVTQPTLLTVPSGGSITQTYYLQDGQSVAVRGLPANVKYALTENPEDYKASGASVSGYTDATTSGSKTISGIDEDGDGIVRTSYKNVRSGAVPTGVFVSILPGAMVALGGGAGFVLLKLRSGRKKEEDE